jgi:hypothetical protein
VAIWGLLTGICFFTAPVSAVQAAHSAKVGLVGYAVSAVIGSAIGACCAFGMRKTGDITATSASRLHSVSLQRWFFRALYLPTLLWIAMSTIVATWAESKLSPFFN